MFRLPLASTGLAAAIIGLTSLLPQVASHAQRIKPFVVGGTEANIADYPYQVGLNLTQNGKEFVCGGALIAPNWVLTAAHCFVEGNTAYLDPGGVEIRTGANDFDSSRMVRTPASKIIVNENYDDTTGTHSDDVALIKASRPIAGIPVLLETKASLSGSAVVTGWGRTRNRGPFSQKLMMATLPLVENETCNRPESLDGRVGSGMLCAGDVDNQSNACQGDSGGPLVQKRPLPNVGTARVQVGIVSWTSEGQCAVRNKYNVYTRVSAYLDWIVTQIVREDGPSLTEAKVSVVMDEVRASGILFSIDELRLLVPASYTLPDPAGIADLVRSLRKPGADLHKHSLPEILLKWSLLGRVRAHASDFFHDVFLLNDGSVTGLEYLPQDNEYGRRDTSHDQLTNVVAVGAWRGRSYALKGDGTLVTWDSVGPRKKAWEESISCHPDC